MAATKKKAAAPKPKPKAPKKPAAPVPEAKPVVFAPKKSTPVKPPPKPVAPPAPARPPVPVAAMTTPIIDPSDRIATLWARLEAWIATIGAPPLDLAKPATEKAIKAAEKDLGRPFPADFRASLRLHDGQTATRSFPWLPGCAPLHTLDTILAEHKKLARAAKPKTDTCDATHRVHPRALAAAAGHPAGWFSKRPT